MAATTAAAMQSRVVVSVYSFSLRRFPARSKHRDILYFKAARILTRVNPLDPEFQKNVESIDPSPTLLDSSLNRAEARVRRVGTLVKLGSKLLTFYLEL